MVENPDNVVGQARLIQQQALDVWLNKPDKNDMVFYPAEKDQAYDMIYQHTDTEADQCLNEDDMLGHVTAVLGLEEDELRVMCQLTENRFLAKTSAIKDGHLQFLVIDSTAKDFIGLQFSWSLQFYYSHFGFGRTKKGGRPVPSADSIIFRCWKNQNGSNLLVLGPAERGLTAHVLSAVPAAKLLDCNQRIIQDFHINLSIEDPDEQNGGLFFLQDGWPSAMAFDPRPGHENEVTLICSYQLDYAVSTTWRDGFLLRYNLQIDEIMVTYTVLSMTDLCLQYLMDGHQVACLQNETQGRQFSEENARWKIWIFNTDNLVPLYTIPLYSLLSGSNLESILMMYSVDQTHVAVLSWRVMDSEDTAESPGHSEWVFHIHGNKVKNKINLGWVRIYRTPFLRRLLTLKQWCNIAILSSCKGRPVDSLPLPDALKHALYGSQQYISYI